MAMPLAHLVNIVGAGGARAGLQFAGIQAQAHRAAHIGDAALVWHQVNHRQRGRTVKLGRVGVIAQEMPGKFYYHQLHSQAQPQVRDKVFAGMANRLELALNAPAAKPPGHQNTVRLFDRFPTAALFQLGRVDPGNIHFHPQRQASVLERLAHAHVCIMQLNILAHQCHFDRWFWTAYPLHQPFPGAPIWCAARF